jgi:hypothetical protein
VDRVFARVAGVLVGQAVEVLASIIVSVLFLFRANHLPQHLHPLLLLLLLHPGVAVLGRWLLLLPLKCIVPYVIVYYHFSVSLGLSFSLLLFHCVTTYVSVGRCVDSCASDSLFLGYWYDVRLPIGHDLMKRNPFAHGLYGRRYGRMKELNSWWHGTYWSRSWVLYTLWRYVS